MQQYARYIATNHRQRELDYNLRSIQQIATVCESIKIITRSSAVAKTVEVDVFSSEYNIKF